MSMPRTIKQGTVAVVSQQNTAQSAAFEFVETQEQKPSQVSPSYFSYSSINKPKSI